MGNLTQQAVRLYPHSPARGAAMVTCACCVCRGVRDVSHVRAQCVVECDRPVLHDIACA
jgi:hypothetical protein